MSKGTLRIATCQFTVGADIRRNSREIRSFLRKAKKAGADIVHFPECALSGYVGTDFATFDGYDWQLLKDETEKIMALAGELKIWVVLGSSHRLTGRNKPHNSLYLISPDGRVADRYDKRFCTKEDLRRFTPGNKFTVFTINSVKCSLLICFDLRFPELYRQLYKRGVRCIFQSFYNARYKGPTIHSFIMRQTMQAHAAMNNFWVSMSNPSGYYSPYPSCFIQPDGKIARQLRSNRSGMIVGTIDTDKKFYDPSAGFRDMAVAGRLSNGPKTIKDKRSRNTKAL